MAAGKKRALWIHGLIVENIKKIKLVRLNLPENRNVIEIAGDNGAGKSSLLDAIQFCLVGPGNLRKGQKPALPVRIGQDQGLVSMDLGEYKITRYAYQNGKNKLVLKDAKGSIIAKGQEVIDELVSNLSFDPLAFADMDAKERLLEIRRITGLDFTSYDAQTAALVTMRGEEGRTIRALKPRIEAIPADLPEKEINTDKISAKLNNAYKHNADVDAKARVIADTIDAAAAEEQDAAAAAERIKELEAEIADLKDAIKLNNANARKLRAQAAKDEKAIPAKIDPKDVKAELDAAIRNNAEVGRAIERKRLVKEQEAAQKKYDDFNAEIENRNADRAEQIRKANMPIEGLSIGEDDVLYNGIPFSQISRGEQVKVSVYIGSALNPKLATMRIKDGAALDKKNMADLKQHAIDLDCQLFIERVDPSDEHAIIIDDGEAVAGDDVVKEPK